MQLPDGTVLMHAGVPYDPVKAHQYYLKTRQLKGRQPGAAKPVPKGRPRKPTFTVKNADGSTSKLSPQQLTEQKQYAAKRVAQIKKNIENLGVVLRDKLQKAKESAAKAAKPPTLAEKAAAARKEMAYRKAHPAATKAAVKKATAKAPAKASGPAPDTVDSLKKEITSAKANLKAAVAEQRSLATAKKNG